MASRSRQHGPDTTDPSESVTIAGLAWEADVSPSKLLGELCRRPGSPGAASGRALPESQIAQRPDMAHQLLFDLPEKSPRARIVLFSLGRHEMHGKSVEKIEDGTANLFVRGGARPEVRRGAAGNARNAPERRRPKVLVFFHQKTRPVPDVLEEPVEPPVQRVVVRDLSVRLLDLLHDVDDLTQDSVEGCDRVVGWWHVARRTGLFHEQICGSSGAHPLGSAVHCTFSMAGRPATMRLQSFHVDVSAGHGRGRRMCFRSK